MAVNPSQWHMAFEKQRGTALNGLQQTFRVCDGGQYISNVAPRLPIVGYLMRRQAARAAMETWLLAANEDEVACTHCLIAVAWLLANDDGVKYGLGRGSRWRLLGRSLNALSVPVWAMTSPTISFQL